MKRKSEQAQEMIKKFEVQEAGVADLAAFYERIESIYVAASQSLQEDTPLTISNSANPKR
jgi:hypothetical protein